MKWTDISSVKYESRLNALQELSPYDLLEINKNASLQEVKKAYRKKIQIYHPDKNSSFSKEYGENVSKLLNNAYNTIINGLK